MNKRPAKLLLNRETVRRLDPVPTRDLLRVGAAGSNLHGVGIVSTDNADDCGTVMSGPE